MTPASPPMLSPALVARIFVPFALGYFLSYLFRAVNAVIGPALGAELALDAGILGLLTSAYFLAFAAFQLPLGILLDRYGSRRTESMLLLCAAAGAFVFARAESVAGLVAGRALIGFGVSACLMAAFHAFVHWFPRERLPLVNGLQLGAGGLGALAATAPVELALAVTDWRGVFLVLALLTATVAVLIFAVVPERGQAPGDGGSLAGQFRGVARVFSSPLFWRVVPWTVASQATFLSVQSLWAGPWLRDVAGLEAGPAATVLAFMAGAMVVGFVLMGTLAERLGRFGIRPMTVASGGMTLFMTVQALLLLDWAPLRTGLWILFGFFGTTGVINYAALSQGFPAQLAGRANTGLNLLVFVAAFGAQWGIGEIIDLFSPGPGYDPAGYRAAFGLLLLLQLLGMAWFLWRAHPSRPDGGEEE
ncbi:MFS transporter [Thioalbus denitrificans]|nr:MFS transporter [Thioalbus denitrificans]